MTDMYRNLFYLSSGLCCLFHKETLQITDVNHNFERYLRLKKEIAEHRVIDELFVKNEDKDYLRDVIDSLHEAKLHQDLDEIEFFITLDESLFLRCSVTLLSEHDQISLRGEISIPPSVRSVTSRKSSLTNDSVLSDPVIPMDQNELLPLFHRIPIGFHCVSLSGHIMYANETLLNILGYTSREYIGKLITDFVDIAILQPMVDAIRAGEVVRNYPYNFTAKDGSIKTCLADSDMKYNADGSPVHSRTFFRYDVNRIVEQAIVNERIAKLGQIAAEKDRFIRIIFHEIKTPLHNLSTRFSNSLKQSNIPHNVVDEMRFQIDACNGLVEDLSFATMFESDQVLHLRPVHMRIRKELDTIIQYISVLNEGEIARKGMKIQKIVDVHIPDVIAVDKALLRVFHNLIHNAVKFCCSSGTVLINLSYIDEAKEGDNNFLFTVTNSVTKPMDLVHTNKLFQSCYYQSSDAGGDEFATPGSSFYLSKTNSLSNIMNTDDSTIPSLDGVNLLRKTDSPSGSPSMRRLTDSPLPKVRGPGTGNPITRLKLGNSSPPGSPRKESPRRTDSPVNRLRHEVSRIRADSNTSVMGEMGQRMNLSVDTTPLLQQQLSSSSSSFQPVSFDDTKKFENISNTLVSNEGLGLGLYVSYNIIQSLGGLLECAGTDKESCFTFSIPVENILPMLTTPVAQSTRVSSVFGPKGVAWSSVTNSSVGNKHIVDVSFPVPPAVTPKSVHSVSRSSSSSITASPRHAVTPKFPSDGAAASSGNPLLPPVEGKKLSRSDSNSSVNNNLSSSSSSLSVRLVPRLVRILVVDDSPICRKVLVKSLESAGYATDTACDGQEACDKLNVAPALFDLVLMDLRMPIMDGLTATRLCKAKVHLAHVPIVIVTAEMGEDIRQAAIDAKAAHFISKPAKVQELLEIIQSLIKW